MLECRLLIVLMLVATSSCLSVRIGDRAPTARVDGLVNGYVSLHGLARKDRALLALDVLSRRGRPGELVSLDVWPVAGFGIGILGARVRVLPLEVGLGTLFYHPKPPPVPPEKTREPEPDRATQSATRTSPNESTWPEGGG